MINRASNTETGITGITGNSSIISFSVTPVGLKFNTGITGNEKKV